MNRQDPPSTPQAPVPQLPGLGFTSVLVANRGEIAVRIIRAAHDAGLRAVVIYADVDVDAPQVDLADAAVHLPGRGAAETYLNAEAVLAAAADTGAQAIHPGYGFLSENADFARAVIAAGLLWIGPDPETIDQLGNKVAARELAASVGAPLAPGSEGPVASWEEAYAFAEAHGTPLAIKAAFGGGGRGLKVARTLDEIEDAFTAAQRESQAAFGRSECFVEKFLERPRHVEAQILADRAGTVVVAGLRDCSLQRRHQKLVEEAPAPFLSPAQHAEICAGAARVCSAAGYVGAGTVEFLIGADGTVSFLEVNTRLQVEHPVTEVTTGIDLVQWQFRIAAGQDLGELGKPVELGEPAELGEPPREPEGSGEAGSAGVPKSPQVGQTDAYRVLPALGHAFEFRLNAEDVSAGFVPSPGRITRFETPTGPGVRMDAGVRTGSQVPGAFDSLMAKLIVWGEDRNQALRRARAALDELVIEGVPSVLPFARAVVRHPDFTAESEAGSEAASFTVHTAWIDTEFIPDDEVQAQLAAFADPPALRLPAEIDGHRARLGLSPVALRRLAEELAALGEGASTGMNAQQGSSEASRTGQTTEGSSIGRGEASKEDDTEDGRVPSPYAGSLVEWKACEGQEVRAGQALAVIEAMKMESTVQAPRAGLLRREALEPGAALEAGQLLARVETGGSGAESGAAAAEEPQSPRTESPGAAEAEA